MPELDNDKGMFEPEIDESTATLSLKNDVSAAAGLKKMMERLLHLQFSEKRKISEKYCELVISNTDTEECCRIIADILGSPVKAAGELTTDELLDLTHDFGEIVDHQTLFKKDFADAIIIAMLWPWLDNEHTTLILAISNR